MSAAVQRLVDGPIGDAELALLERLSHMNLIGYAMFSFALYIGTWFGLVLMVRLYGEAYDILRATGRRRRRDRQ